MNKQSAVGFVPQYLEANPNIGPMGTPKKRGSPANANLTNKHIHICIHIFIRVKQGDDQRNNDVANKTEIDTMNPSP